MKKQLIVVAASALASTLPSWGADFQVGANTNFSISGLVAVGAKDSLVSKINPSDTATHNSEFRVDDNTSRLIVAGATNLKWPGWQAIFNIESRFTTNAQPIDPLMPGLPPQMAQQYTAGTMTGWADGDTWGGVASPYGKLVFGKTTLYYQDSFAGAPGAKGAGESYRAWDGNGTGLYNLLSQVGTSIRIGGNALGGLSLQTLQITRAQNVVRYDSPTFAGIDCTVAYTKNPYGQENNSQPAQYGRAYTDGGTWWERVRYNNGGFTASASKLDIVVQGGNNNSLQGIYLNDAIPGIVKGPMDTHAYRLAAGYTMPMGLKFGVVYDSTAVDNGVIGTTLQAKRSVITVPVSYSWGDNAVYATYNKAGNTSNIADSGATQMTFGYDYALTKRIFAGIFLTTLSNQTNGNYQPFLSSTVLGGTAPTTGENWRQISIDLNYWF
jgi:hypothetical protein